MLAAAFLAATLANGAPPYQRPPIRADDVVWRHRPLRTSLCRWRESPTGPPDLSIILACTISAQGRLSQCHAVEPVANSDEFDCLLRNLPHWRMRLRTRSGQPVAGRTISFPVRFKHQ